MLGCFIEVGVKCLLLRQESFTLSQFHCGDDYRLHCAFRVERQGSRVEESGIRDGEMTF